MSLLKYNGAGALKHRDFRLLLAGDAVSQFGSAMFPIALVGLVAEPHGPAILGLLLGVQGIVVSLLGLPAGALINRYKKKHVLIVAHTGELLVVLGYATNPHSVSTLLVLATLSGVFSSAVRPAAGSLLPLLLPAEHLQQANALKGIANRGAGIAGPAVAGLLLTLTSASVVFVIDAMTFLMVIAALAVIREKRLPRDETGPRHFLADLKEGLAEVRRRPWVVAIIAIATVQAPLTIAPGFTLLPIVAAADYSPSTYGLAMSCMAVGEVVGGLLATKWTPRRPGLVSLVGVMPYPLVLLALAATAPVGIIFTGYVLIGIGFMLFGVYWYTALQRDIPPDRLGVVFSIDQVGSFGLQPVGYAVSGALANMVGAKPVLVGAGLFGVLTTLIPLAVPGVPRLADQPSSKGQSSELGVQTS
ncbi:MFS transporter [Streptomyces sp. NPDC057438]|uniref:MFS transporter n=1 Tax=Streptomyces sp. NPDC057438 TaxID=3346133 RepID=UPI0036CF64D0